MKPLRNDRSGQCCINALGEHLKVSTSLKGATIPGECRCCRKAPAYLMVASRIRGAKGLATKGWAARNTRFIMSMGTPAREACGRAPPRSHSQRGKSTAEE
eukprot:6064310-Amphidinium_carterae.1